MPDRVMTAPGTVRTGSSPLLSVRALSAIARLAETRPWVFFIALSLFCAWGRLHALTSRHLDHDELFTFYIAQARTLGDLLHLSRTVDLHPPLSYLLVRASFSIFGITSWSCRLPFLLAFFIAGGLLFWLTRHLLSAVYACSVVLLFWSNPFAYQAEEARPYSLVVCFTAMMLVSWRRAIDEEEPTRRLALVVLITSGFGLLLSHVLAVIPYGMFLAAELVRFWKQRKYDWSLWAAFFVPLSAVVFYLPLLHSHSGMLFAREYAATPRRIASFYWESVRHVATPLLAIAVISVLWPVLRRTKPAFVYARTPTDLPFGLLLFGFSATPLVIASLFAHTGTAFFDRYGIVLVIPLALGPAFILGRRTSCDWLAGTAVALLLATVFTLNSWGKAWLIEQVAGIAPPSVAARLDYIFAPPPLWHWSTPPIPDNLVEEFRNAPTVSHLDAVEPELPIVAHTGLTFLELDHQESTQVTQRLYFISDERAAAGIAHDTVFGHYERLKELFPIRGRIEPYCGFVAAHPHFLVVGAYNNPQGWLLRRLDQDGAEIRVSGICPANTEQCQIYDVKVRSPQCQ
jgi:4-amino-4-deoxy-L-arabinose transferase-like glycosyltransferase